MRPSASDYAPYYQRYVSLVQGTDVIEALEQQSTVTQRLLGGVDDARGSYRYAEGKWSVKEVVGHVIDAERVFAFRALTFSRGDGGPLPSFDENAWSGLAGWDDWRIGEVAEEYALVRRSNLLLFRNLPSGAWDRKGTASDSPVTVRALAWIIAGHELHHLAVLRERYLLQSAT